VGIPYTTREDVASSQDIKATAYAARDIDSAIQSGARAVDALVHRVLYPWQGTRYFDFPNGDSPSYRIRFGEFDLLSSTAIVNGDGTTIAGGNTFLKPQSGPPYTSIEVNRGSVSYFTAGSTNQRAVAITGLWAVSNVEAIAGTVTEPLDTTETGVDSSAMPYVGVGSLIRVDAERMLVTGKSWLTTGQTATLAASNAAQTLAVADSTAFVIGDLLLIEAERVAVLDIAGNTLIVRRAQDGSPLAAHAGATIYAQRSLTVERGAAGTTAATHLTSAPAYVWQPPPLAAELNRAYAINNLLQRQSGYARIEGENRSGEKPGRGITQLEEDVRSALGKMMRHRAV
jgi:flagellar basal body rod protein FlgG